MPVGGWAGATGTLPSLRLAGNGRPQRRMKIRELFEQARYGIRLQSATGDGVLDELAALASGGGSDRPRIYKVLADRERLGSTAVGGGVAIPHGKLPGLTTVRLAAALHPGGVEFGAADGKPARLFVVLLAPDNDPSRHLKVLARIARIVKEPRHRDRILDSRTPAEMLRAFVDADEQVA